MFKKQSILYIFLFLGIANPSIQQAMPAVFWIQKILVAAIYGKSVFGYLNKKLPKKIRLKNKTDKKLKNKYKKMWSDFHCELLKMLNEDQRNNLFAYLGLCKKYNPTSAQNAETNFLTVAYISFLHPQKQLFSYTL